MEGLPESFVAALRDARNLDWKKSIMGVIKTSLAHGPVYFDVYPNLTLSISDDNILDALTLNVKTHGYNYAQGSESEDGSISLNFGNNQNHRLSSLRSNSMRSYISPYDYHMEPPSTSRYSTSQLPETTCPPSETDSVKNSADEPIRDSKNLRCKTLTDYRWYKDAFLCRVMELPDSSSAHWKAKFIDGLSHLFAERAKTILRDQSGSIPYNEYSYGRLIGACTEQGLKLCNEIILNQQIKRQNLAERNQLGDFCEQFGMDMPPYPNKKRKAAREINNKSFHRKKRNKPYFKGNQFDKNNKKSIKPYRKRRFKYKTDNKIICYKCNRIGHYAKDCWTKKAISTLEIDDNIKDKLYKLLLTSDREGTYSSSSDSSDNEIKNMDNDTYYSDSSSTICEPCLKGKECIKDNDLYNLISQFEEHRINVLDNNSWVELLKVVKDPEIRSKIIDQIGNETSSSNNRVIIPDNEPYSMTKVHSLLKARQTNSHPSSLKDILLEIENLKSEIRQLKN
ncbi:hypothetical protein RND81_12G049400 [Saponaria officinalis]|uniref:CCHC-type domain-containing protein n=1 Tax=Saponaria officinalis TaxID=3572 RepID=A0AAW1H765_SAPOF